MKVYLIRKDSGMDCSVEEVNSLMAANLSSLIREGFSAHREKSPVPLKGYNSFGRSARLQMNVMIEA